MAKIIRNLSDLIGNTPLLRLNKLSEEYGVEILGKLESFNPGSSVKDRIGYNMIIEAEKAGKLKPGSTIIEPTSGNTGIALAWIAAIRGYKVILTMPETMTVERRNLLKAYGAKVVLTEGPKGMKGAINKAHELAGEIENSFVPEQFKNPANPDIHRKTTALEIWKDTDGKVDIFVAGVGTGGTLTGVGEILKEKNNGIKMVAVEPEDSPVISGGSPGPHKIQGIGAGFIPDVLNTKIIDEVIKIKNEEAFKTSVSLAKTEGLLCGISAGANVMAAIKIAERKENQGKTIVAIIPDTGERYLSTSLFDD